MATGDAASKVLRALFDSVECLRDGSELGLPEAWRLVDWPDQRQWPPRLGQ